MRTPVIVFACAALSASGGTVPQQWTVQESGVEVTLRGVSATGPRVAWASGARGTVLLTIDGGRSWQPRPIPGAEGLDIRDIDAFGVSTAYALSIGAGYSSRIFKTIDGGVSWTTQFVNTEPDAFFDAMDFWDAGRGIAVSDSVNGRFLILSTADGGQTWTPVPQAALPPALPGEGYFAASGSNVATWGREHVWLGTGAADQARVLRSVDGGESWDVAVTPLPAGSSSGIFSIAFRDAEHGIVVGGDYREENAAADNVAVSADGGATWRLPAGRGLSGFRSAVAWVPRSPTPLWVAVGPSGADLSRDDGQSWEPLEAPGFHALSFSPLGPVAFAVGAEGRIGRFDVAAAR